MDDKQIYRSLATGAAHSAANVLAFGSGMNSGEFKRFGVAAASDYVTCKALSTYDQKSYYIWQPIASGAAYVAASKVLMSDGLPWMYQFLIQAGASYVAPSAYDRLALGMGAGVSSSGIISKP